jgi:hypothetical protein
MLNSGNNDREQNLLLLSPRVERGLSDCNPWDVQDVPAWLFLHCHITQSGLTGESSVVTSEDSPISMHCCRNLTDHSKIREA